MNKNKFDYIIVGAGLAGASAIEGIRQVDAQGSVLFIGAESQPPYHRPPLTKGLWSGKKTPEDIFVHKTEFYDAQNVTVRYGARIVSVDTASKSVTDAAATEYGFEKLLLATGGTPNRLSIPGGDLDGIMYYRYLDDYLNLAPLAREGKSALVIGGGFIGTEIAAALTLRNLEITMLFPEKHPCSRIFPRDLGNHILEEYKKRGVTMLTEDVPVAIEKNNAAFRVRTKNGRTLDADIVIAGIGLSPSTELAKTAGLAVADGIAVNSFLQTSHPDMYAAGDNAQFPEHLLHISRRAEHWDSALNQGKHAGKNMAGAREPYTYLSYFFSDLFDFGYEAVGDIDSRLQTRAQWSVKNVKGIVYYTKENKIRGMLMCNEWDKVDYARGMIMSDAPPL
jgi:3-phenylpropionate/trans-cinnamate dioxygenase ferredoxin reductase subunit